MTPVRAAPMLALLRAFAVAIAIAAIVDPAVSMHRAGRPTVAVVNQLPDLPAANQVRARLVDALGASHELVPRLTSDAAGAIVIGDRYPDEPVPANLVVATVTMPESAPLVRLVSLTTPPAIPPGTAIRAEAAIDGSAAAGSSEFVVSIGGLEVGRVAHAWTGERERWRAVIDAVPVGEPPWVLRAAVVPQGTPPGADPAAAYTVVALRREPLRVQIYEPRPSWATTFVRRALEADARFRVESISLGSRGIAARTPGSATLGESHLDTFDVVIVGGVERLTSSDVRALDRFMRDRGGAVALLPDSRANTGAVRGLLQSDFAERLLQQPETLSATAGAPAIAASELLLLNSAGGLRGDVVASASDGTPVITSAAYGRGRLFVSGAMDAWRYRASSDRAFDRFWQATVAGLALGARPPIEVTVSPAVLRPLERAQVSVRVRAADAAAVTASAGGIATRLWPEPEVGAFRSAFEARGTPGRIAVEVGVTGPSAYAVTREVVVAPPAVMPRRTIPPLSLLASSHRGIDVSPDRTGELASFMRETVSAAPVAGVRRPMRSPWWLLPFAAALSVEWAARRRRGRR